MTPRASIPACSPATARPRPTTAPPTSAGRSADGVATVTLNRPERKNPLTFDSYAELRDLFGLLQATPTTCRPW